MAERIVSPGVFTNEYDQSYLPQGISAIGAAIIGPTSRGPAFIPTVVTSYSEFVEKFGGTNDETYVPYAVKEYLENAGTMTIVRVLNLSGYKVKNIPILAVAPASATGSELKVATVLHPTYRTYTPTGEGLNQSYITGSSNTFDPVTGFASASRFDLVLGVSSGSFNLTQSYTNVSFNPASPNYIGKALGTSPKVNYKPTPVTSNGALAYRYLTFDRYCDSLSELTGSDAPFVTMSFATIDLSGSSGKYSSATTPWIKSQLVNGVSYPLFYVACQSHGQDLNTVYKIGILNIKRAGEVPGSNYGSFSLVVRAINDTDKAPIVLESFNDLNLDPTSPNFIARVIGDRYATYNPTSKKIVWHGDYMNKSKYIYIVLDENVKTGTYSPDLVPYGFAELYEPFNIPSTSGPIIRFPTASFVTQQRYNGVYNSKIYFGFDFDFDSTDNKNYLMPITDNATTGSNIDFILDNYFTDIDSPGQGCSMSSSLAPLSARKFIVPFQGGFDGFDPSIPKAMGVDISSTNTMGMDCSNPTADGYKAYKIALDLLSNADQYDINLLLTPGIIDKYHSGIISYAVDMCESRQDTFYIFDCTPLESNNPLDAVDQAANYDTNYAATYYPWLKIFDAERNKYVFVPPSVSVAGAISYNDKVGYEWFAPAGLDRGALKSARDVYTHLTRQERDELYEGRVNPIAFFPNEGIVVWGQKTLQAKPSALDRVNVRRLLINLKKFIASTSRYLVFEPNTSATRNRFLNIVKPYMESIQQRFGLYAFKVIMDETNNTSDIIDRNILYGQIFIQPTRTAEFIIIDFNVMPTGASFPGE